MTTRKTHNVLCDIDPETLRWRRSIKKGETANICRECREAVIKRAKELAKMQTGLKVVK